MFSSRPGGRTDCVGLHGFLRVVGGDHNGGGHGAGIGQFHQVVPDGLPGTDAH